MKSVSFVNSERGTGNLTIAKEVQHEFGVAYRIPDDKLFTVQVTLDGIGTANATFKAEHTDGSYTQITTDANGSFTVELAHDRQLEIFDLPAGTTAIVVEQDPGLGFTPAYWDNGVLGDGVVTVVADTTVSVIIANDYKAAEVYPVAVVVMFAALTGTMDVIVIITVNIRPASILKCFFILSPSFLLLIIALSYYRIRWGKKQFI